MWKVEKFVLKPGSLRKMMLGALPLQSTSDFFPSKTTTEKLTENDGKTNHGWRCISYCKSWRSIVMLVFRGVNGMFGDFHVISYHFPSKFGSSSNWKQRETNGCWKFPQIGKLMLKQWMLKMDVFQFFPGVFFPKFPLIQFSKWHQWVSTPCFLGRKIWRTRCLRLQQKPPKKW